MSIQTQSYESQLTFNGVYSRNVVNDWYLKLSFWILWARLHLADQEYTREALAGVAQWIVGLWTKNIPKNLQGGRQKHEGSRDILTASHIRFCSSAGTKEYVVVGYRIWNALGWWEDAESETCFSQSALGSTFYILVSFDIHNHDSL